MENGISKIRSLKMLKIFVTVSDLGSFTASSPLLHMSQSAVSQQIKRLEEIVGFDLFFRRSRGVALTEQGVQFLNKIRPSLTLFDENKSCEHDTNKDIRISMPALISQQWVQRWLNNFPKEFTEFDIHLNEIEDNYFEHENIDLALAKVHISEEKNLSKPWQFCEQDTIVPVCAPSYLEKKNEKEIANWESNFNLLESFNKDELNISWNYWLSKQDTMKNRKKGFITFENHSIALEAAKAGCGVVLASMADIGNSLHTLSLVTLPSQPLLSNYSYYTMLKNSENEKRTKALNWLYKSIISLTVNPSRVE